MNIKFCCAVCSFFVIVQSIRNLHVQLLVQMEAWMCVRVCGGGAAATNDEGWRCGVAAPLEIALMCTEVAASLPRPPLEHAPLNTR